MKRSCFNVVKKLKTRKVFSIDPLHDFVFFLTRLTINVETGNVHRFILVFFRRLNIEYLQQWHT